MALQLRWTSCEELDRVAETRWHCYAHSGKDLERYKEMARDDVRAASGDFLLAERDGVAVGTATSLSMTMWVRGSPMTCQGVAWVGAIKTARRRSTPAGGEDRGVASAVMREVVAEGRKREQVISALMPFRTSFYEHFGYGIIERKAEWTIPLSTLPSGSCDGWRPFAAEDLVGVKMTHQRIVQTGQCDIERGPAAWKPTANPFDDAMAFVLPGEDGVRAWAALSHQFVHGRDLLRLESWGNDSQESFCSLLGFMGTLRDQYYSVTLHAPADFQLNRLLKEPQLPHRPVNHATADVRILTRMQARILNHQKFLEALNLPRDAAGRVDVAVRESEGETSKFKVEFSNGRATVKPGGSGGFECSDVNWAAIACGDLRATDALRMGLAKASSADAAAVLDHLAARSRAVLP